MKSQKDKFLTVTMPTHWKWDEHRVISSCEVLHQLSSLCITSKFRGIQLFLTNSPDEGQTKSLEWKKLISRWTTCYQRLWITNYVISDCELRRLWITLIVEDCILISSYEITMKQILNGYYANELANCDVTMIFIVANYAAVTRPRPRVIALSR